VKQKSEIQGKKKKERKKKRKERKQKLEDHTTITTLTHTQTTTHFLYNNHNPEKVKTVQPYFNFLNIYIFVLPCSFVDL
jgi:flagellar motor protein MotB